MSRSRTWDVPSYRRKQQTPFPTESIEVESEEEEEGEEQIPREYHHVSYYEILKFLEEYGTKTTQEIAEAFNTSRQKMLSRLYRMAGKNLVAKVLIQGEKQLIWYLKEDGRELLGVRESY